MAGSPTPVALIKEKLDIVEFLRGHLTLHPAGKNFKALCPFHKEKTPSFMVSPDRQSWHCFGCALGGDVFSFVMQYENIEFGEALRVLAEKAGVELRRLNPSEYKLTGALYDLNAKARDFFREQLKAFASAQQYLSSRRLHRETIDEFELGFAPPGPEALTLHLLHSGSSPDEIIQAGLALRTERGLVIDRFRGRVMFPIYNHFGKVAGFTGRVLPHEDPERSEGTGANPSTSSGLAIAKYINTPETPVFQKSKILYGFSKTKNAIRDAKCAFLVEGQMDCVMSVQAGIPNAVAASGTALTVDHLKTLRRVAETLVFSFDNDEAGWAAGERAIDLAHAEDFEVKVVTFKDVKDPGEAAAENPEGLRKAVAEAKPAALFYFEKYLTDTADFGSREGLSRLRAVLRKVQGIQSAVTRDFWFKELSRRTAVGENVLREEAEKIGDRASPLTPAPAANLPAGVSAEAGVGRGARTRLDLLSERMLAYAAARGDFSAAATCVEYFPPLYLRGFELLREGKKASGDPELDAVLHAVFLREELVKEEAWELLREELTKEYFRKRREALTRAVRLAESRGDEAGVRSALDELRKIPHNA